MLRGLRTALSRKSVPKRTQGTMSKETTDAEWKARLTREEYRVLRKKGTDPAFRGTPCTAAKRLNQKTKQS